MNLCLVSVPVEYELSHIILYTPFSSGLYRSRCWVVWTPKTFENFRENNQTIARFPTVCFIVNKFEHAWWVGAGALYRGGRAGAQYRDPHTLWIEWLTDRQDLKQPSPHRWGLKINNDKEKPSVERISKSSTMYVITMWTILHHHTCRMSGYW